MKILILSDAWLPQLNGVVRTYQNTISELEKLGHDIKILGPQDFKWKIATPWDVDLTLFPSRKIKETLTNYKPDRVHIAVEGPIGWTASRLCRKDNIPFTTSYHTDFPTFLVNHLRGPFKYLAKPVYRFSTSILRKFHNRGNGIFVATKELETRLKNQNFKGPFLPLTRGTDPRYFYVGKKTLFKDLSQPIALYVGRVSKEKNLDAFLSATWEGSKIVVGDGADLDRLKKSYPSAHFLGRKEGKELGECFRSADIFAFPSKFDTFGIVMIEALACGLPIAAFNANGARSIITDQMLGAMDDNFAAAMQKALNASGTREKRANHATTLYSWGKTAKQFLDLPDDYG